MKHFMPVRIFTGQNCIKDNPGVFTEAGSRCLIITGRSSAAKSGILEHILKELADQNVTYSVFDEISPNPLVESCRQAGIAAAGFNAGFIIGIGGGSALDAAKAAAIFAANPGMDEAGLYNGKWENDPLPILLVGTTAGTGSEVTNVSVLTDSSGKKHSIHDDRLFARAAFGDPQYMMQIPQEITVSTALDALCHCVESYFSRKASDISRVYAAKGAATLIPLIDSLEEQPDLQTRTELYDASIYGGLAINLTGTVFPHNVGYLLTEKFKVPHGFACAAFLPALIDLMNLEYPELVKRFCSEAGTEAGELKELIQSHLILPRISLTEAEIDAALPRWENNATVSNTLAAVDSAFIRKILTEISAH